MDPIDNMSEELERKERQRQYKKEHYIKNKQKYYESAKRHLERINADSELRDKMLEKKRELYRQKAAKLREYLEMQKKQELMKFIEEVVSEMLEDS